MKGQHWTAVCHDLVIVVLGVFIGLQVDNWNQARIQHDALDRQRTILRVEMQANLTSIGSWKKKELIKNRICKTRQLAIDPVSYIIESHDNRTRRHQLLDGIGPGDVEAAARLLQEAVHKTLGTPGSLKYA